MQQQLTPCFRNWCSPSFLATLILWRVREQRASMGVSRPGKKSVQFRFSSLFSLPLISDLDCFAHLFNLGERIHGIRDAQHLRASAPKTPKTRVWYAFGAVGVRLIASKAPDFLGPVNFVVPSIATYGCAFIGLSEAIYAWHYALAGVLAGFGHGFCFPVLTSLVIGSACEGGTSRALALFTALWEIAALSTTEPRKDRR